MVEDPAAARGGLIARLRDARRNVALFTAPESPRAKTLTLVLLVALTVGIFGISSGAGLNVAPPLTLAVPLVLGGFLLDRPALQILLVVVAVGFGAEVAQKSWAAVRPGSAVVLGILGFIAVELARDRERLGLSVGRGEAILLELRDQLRLQGELPDLPPGWDADVAQRSAGGTAFGGDFIVSALSDDGKRLELAIVDVSGKGLDAGTRGLLLAGALGGLLGSIAPERFLRAANDYLLRQEPEESFATALHVAIDLSTGNYRLTTAGHPPAVHYSGGSGRWQIVEMDGDLLGVMPEAQFGVAEGQLMAYDALLLYTDGLIEVPGRDLSLGIDRLLGAAEGLIPRGFADGAQAIVDAVAPTGNDDRAVVLLWRS
jgi:hypothetical protein